MELQSIIVLLRTVARYMQFRLQGRPDNILVDF